MKGIPEKLLKIIACPKCKGELKQKSSALLCSRCELAYPILEERILNLLIEDALTINGSKKPEDK